jgi:hypothetical protein
MSTRLRSHPAIQCPWSAWLAFIVSCVSFFPSRSASLAIDPATMPSMLRVGTYGRSMFELAYTTAFTWIRAMCPDRRTAPSSTLGLPCSRE